MGIMYCPVETSGWGDCELFDADGSFFMVDTWTNGATKIRQFVRSKLGRRKMALFLSHGHKDHNGDYRYYIENNMVDHLYIGGFSPAQETSKDLDRWRSMIDLAKKKGIAITYLTTGKEFTIGNAKIKCLYAKATGSNNGKSLCLRITMNGVKIILCGDAEPSTIAGMIASGIDFSGNIVKMNHHGVKENNTSTFAKHAKAEYVFCNCCGENSKTFRSWAKDSYRRFEDAGANCVSVLYNQGLAFDCFAGEVNVIMGGNYATAVKEVTSDGFTVKRQFHYNKLEKLNIRGSMKYVNLQLAKDVICGMYGNGEERRRKLGSKYEDVQKLVNSTITYYAKRMIAGDGGNGEEKRTEWLRKSGFFNNPALAYEVIQSKVNSMI